MSHHRSSQYTRESQTFFQWKVAGMHCIPHDVDEELSWHCYRGVTDGHHLLLHRKLFVTSWCMLQSFIHGIALMPVLNV